MIVVGGDPNPDYLYLSEILAFGRLRKTQKGGEVEAHKGRREGEEKRYFLGYTDNFMNKHRGSYLGSTHLKISDSLLL